MMMKKMIWNEINYSFFFDYIFIVGIYRAKFSFINIDLFNLNINKFVYLIMFNKYMFICKKFYSIFFYFFNIIIKIHKNYNKIKIHLFF